MQITVTFDLDPTLDKAATAAAFQGYLTWALAVPEDLKDADPYNITKITVHDPILAGG